MSISGIDLEHNTYAFWKDNVECSGGSCKIYTGNLTDYNNARELERTQGWTNTEVILKRDFYSLGIVLSSEANLQGKTGEIYTSTISGRMEGSKTGVLTFKDLYEANKISKEEYESTKGWSKGYQGAAWSEYVGPVVGGTSTYIAGKNGLLNQNTSSKNSGEKSVQVEENKTVKITTDLVAKNVAESLGGEITELKNGYKIEIPNGRKPIVVRVMSEGSGGRSEPYYRVSIDGKGSLTMEGQLSADKGLTHVNLSGNSLQEIKQMIEKYLGDKK